MSRENFAEVGKGWKSVPALKTTDVLVLKVIDIVAGKRESFSWRCFDPANNKSARLPTSIELPIGVPAPTYWPESGLLLYESVAGITSLSTSTLKEEILIPIDCERYRIRHLFCSPESKGQIAYVLGEFADDRTIVKAKLSGTGGPFRLPIKEFSLHLWESSNRTSRKITTFEASPVSAEVDWPREILCALIGEGRQRDLIRLEFGSGRVDVATKTDSLASLTVSPSGTLLAWNQHDSPRIIKVLAENSQAPLTEFGWFPAYSSSGVQFAFTVSDHEVWVGGESVPEKVIAFPPGVTQRSNDKIVWNPSGDAFSVFLAQGAVGGGRNRPLVIADCSRREVMLYSDFISVGSTGERAWVPRESVGRLF